MRPPAAVARLNHFARVVRARARALSLCSQAAPTAAEVTATAAASHDAIVCVRASGAHVYVSKLMILPRQLARAPAQAFVRTQAAYLVYVVVLLLLLLLQLTGLSSWPL